MKSVVLVFYIFLFTIPIFAREVDYRPVMPTYCDGIDFRVVITLKNHFDRTDDQAKPLDEYEAIVEKSGAPVETYTVWSYQKLGETSSQFYYVTEGITPWNLKVDHEKVKFFLDFSNDYLYHSLTTSLVVKDEAGKILIKDFGSNLTRCH